MPSIGVPANRARIPASPVRFQKKMGASGNFGIWHKTAWGDDGGINSQNNETYLLNRLAGYDAIGNNLGYLPSTRDSLQ